MLFLVYCPDLRTGRRPAPRKGEVMIDSLRRMMPEIMLVAGILCWVAFFQLYGLAGIMQFANLSIWMAVLWNIRHARQTAMVS